MDTVLPTGVKPKPPEVSYASQLDASRQWKRRNKDRQTEYMRGWRTANPEKLRESHWRGAGVKVGDRYFTQGDYNQAYEEQEGKCLGCSKVVPRFHVDHDHDTDQFRGLLCPSCNVRDVLSL